MEEVDLKVDDEIKEVSKENPKKEKLLDLDDIYYEMAKLKVELKTELYKDEKGQLLIERKNQLLKRLYTISHNLKSKKNIEEFLIDKKDYISDTFQFGDSIKNYNKKVLFFLIKILGPLFLICFLVVLFQIMEYIVALKEEVFDAIKVYLKLNTKKVGDDFYSRIKFKEHNTVPSLSLFFISSFLSGLLLQYLNFFILTTFDFIFIGLILYFEIHSFNFVKNKEYSLKNIIKLILYLIGIDSLLGLIALLPMQLLMNGYFIYEKSIQVNQNSNRNIINKDSNNINNTKKKELNINPVKKNKNNIISTKEEKESLINYEISNEDSFHIIDINFDEEIIKEPKNKENIFYHFNGLVISYFLSFIISIIIRDGINTEIANPVNKIIIYISLAVSSLFLYCFYSLAFDKKKKSKSQTNISVKKFCGYLYYKEEKAPEKKICCKGCRIGMRKCYFCCTIFHCFSCCRYCECTVCCPCIPISECCKKKVDLSEKENEDEKICLIYKLKGFCSYICDYLTDFAYMFMVISLIYVKLLSFGFNITLNKYMNSNDEDENAYLNLAFLGGIILYYVSNIFLGYLFNENLIKFYNQNYKKSESSFIGIGVIPLLFFINIICLLFSILINYDIVNKDIKNYLMSISKSGTEYYYLMITKFVIVGNFNNNDGIEILSYSTFSSLFLLIFNFLISFLENLDEKTLIFIQYIINLLFFIVESCYITCMCVCFRILGVKKREDLFNEIKKREQLVIKKKERLKELEKLEKEEIDKLVLKEIQEEYSRLKAIIYSTIENVAKENLKENENNINE